MIAAAGFDAIYVDLEHNPTSLETCSMLCVAGICAAITPIVRIGSQDGTRRRVRWMAAPRG